MSLRAALWQLLACGLLPAWLLAGAADWLCHRRTHIERTSGPQESLLHLLLYFEIALPLLLGLWFEVNAMLLSIMAAGVATHMLTSWWDTSFSQPKRYISPIEQQVHSWLEMLPLFAFVLVALLHLDALATPRWSLEWRAQPLPGVWRMGIPAALAAGVVPIVEEYLRARRA
jgi:hypothetical protein